MGVALAAVVGLSVVAGATWAQREQVALPNSGFEQAGGTVAPAALLQTAVVDGVPAGWVAGQWAPVASKFEIGIETGSGRAAGAACATRNLDATARPGIATRVDLPAGRYALTFFARCQEGKEGLVRAYVGDAYLPLQRVGPTWSRVTSERSVRGDLSQAEIRLENCSRSVTTVWFDDVSLERSAPRTVGFLPDKRRRPPRMLLLSPLTLEELQRDAAAWAERGFGGFLLDGIVNDWAMDIWSVDGDPATMGEDDARLQQALSCNAACRPHGIITFLYVPCTTPLPDWLDDDGWTNAIEAIQQAAVFAARAQCQGLAIDLEPVAQQFWPQWQGYNYNRYTKAALRQAAVIRGRQIARVVFGAQPTLELVLMPEGLLEYGPLYGDLFRGIMEQAGEARHRGGVHLLAKGTLDLTSAEDVLQYPASVDTAVMTLVNPAAQRYWQKHCSLALGCWPLGYARRITDASGAPVGWGGRPDVFGDELVGEYVDRGPRYPIEQFREQFAAARTVATKYVWIDAHGATWWRDKPAPDTSGMTSAEAAKARAQHTVENIEEYYAIVRAHEMVKVGR